MIDIGAGLIHWKTSGAFIAYDRRDVTACGIGFTERSQCLTSSHSREMVTCPDCLWVLAIDPIQAIIDDDPADLLDQV